MGVLMLLRRCLLIICGLLVVIWPSKAEKDKLWEKDMSQEVYIEASVEGLKGLHFQCFKDKMKVTVELADHVEDYDGVVYTRGSYSMGKGPCFYDAKGTPNEELSLEWSFDECKTKKRKDGKLMSNVVIVQQDDMLIYPGDMAFEVICETESQLDELIVQATIGLEDPDPGAKRLPLSKRQPVTAEKTVTFIPKEEEEIAEKDEL